VGVDLRRARCLGLEEEEEEKSGHNSGFFGCPLVFVTTGHLAHPLFSMRDSASLR